MVADQPLQAEPEAAAARARLRFAFWSRASARVLAAEVLALLSFRRASVTALWPSDRPFEPSCRLLDPSGPPAR